MDYEVSGYTVSSPVYTGLVIITINGYDYKIPVEMITDLPGSANFFLQDLADQDMAAIWSDYDCPPDCPWRFSILVPQEALEAVRDRAERFGYQIVDEAPVTAPGRYGDGYQGTVALCQHPAGWVVVY